MNKPPVCWCGNKQLQEFSPDYLRCAKCETLVVKSFPPVDLEQIQDEKTDLYGANYAERHLQEDYGLPDFATRIRNDLPERCLHWLKGVLRYKLPPASLLELGSFHGGFVGLAKLAGYQARGLDLSPDLSRQAAARFDIEVLTGPLEKQAIPPGSLDLVVLFDVLEHLQNPRRTLEKCREILRPDGVVVIQTPRYREGRTFAEMQAGKDTFLIHFKPAEHLYLFSKKSVQRLLEETGLPHINFEPPVFAHYDMFPFASASPLKVVDGAAKDEALAASTGGRFATALLDLDARLSASQQLQGERNLLQAQLVDLQKNFAGTEKDRLERGEVIETQGRKLTKLEGEFDERLKELKVLYTSAETYKNERNLLQAQLADLQKNFAAAEKDRLERGTTIEAQGRKLSQLEGEFDTRLKELKTVYASAETYKNERNLLRAQLADLQKNFAAAEKDRLERGKTIEAQGRKLSQLEGEFDTRLKELKSLYVSADALKNERNLLQAQLADLQNNFAAAEADRLARGQVIETQGLRVSELERLVWLTEANRDYWKHVAEKQTPPP